MKSEAEPQIQQANATLAKVLQELTTRATGALHADDPLRAQVYLKQLSILAAQGEENQAKVAAYRDDT